MLLDSRQFLFLGDVLTVQIFTEVLMLSEIKTSVLT